MIGDDRRVEYPKTVCHNQSTKAEAAAAVTPPLSHTRLFLLLLLLSFVGSLLRQLEEEEEDVVNLVPTLAVMSVAWQATPTLRQREQ